MSTPGRKRKRELADEIVGRLVRRHSIAIVLFHQAVAERLGLGPTDHKCLDLLRERGPMTGSDLAAITDLTTGAITGVVARLERAGYVRREPDPHDRRQQILSPVLERMRDIQHVFGPIRNDAAALLERFDTQQLAAIAEFLTGSTDLAYRHVALLRAQATAPPPDSTGLGRRPALSQKLRLGRVRPTTTNADRKERS
jgi:DNA-binding MarR family transcriptional regulator